MTLPPGLQAIRERAKEITGASPLAIADAFRDAYVLCGKDVPTLLDLIEELAGALELAYTHYPYAVEDEVKAALTKYREFGQ